MNNIRGDTLKNSHQIPDGFESIQKPNATTNQTQRMDLKPMRLYFTQFICNARGNVYFKPSLLCCQGNRQAVGQEEPVHIHNKQQFFNHKWFSSNQA